MSVTITVAEAKVKRLEEELNQAQAALRAAQDIAEAENYADPHLQALATALHELNCHADHTDGCDWFYGVWGVKMMHGHKVHYEWAKRLVQETGMDAQTLASVIQNAKSTRNTPRK